MDDEDNDDENVGVVVVVVALIAALERNERSGVVLETCKWEYRSLHDQR